MKYKLVVGLVLMGMMSFLAGCQSVRKALDMNTAAEIEFVANDDINPDPDGRASPVVIHVFKLADDRQFRRLDFLSLYESPEARLGKDLIDTVVLKELTPGDKRTELIKLTPEVRYLGVMAEFSQYRDADPILILPVLGYNVNSFRVTVQADRISVPEEPKRTAAQDPHFRQYKK